MPDFNVRSDAVNVEQIMEQIRARIREKRGVDYTEAEIKELASVKLEKFLDPRGVRSDLLEQFRRAQPPYAPPELPNFAFEDQTLFESTRGPLRFIRRLLQPILKLFFNPNPLIQALNIQSKLNASAAEREAKRDAARYAFDQLHYEVMHNLVIETTRLGIEVKNVKMRIESLASRLEFNERRARALESAVVYKPAADDRATQDGRRDESRRDESRREEPRRDERREDSRRLEARRGEPRPPQTPQQPVPPPEPAASLAPEPAVVDGTSQTSTAAAEGPGTKSRRRRRRRGRRGSGAAAAIMANGTAESGTATEQDQVAGDELDADIEESEPDVAETAATLEEAPRLQESPSAFAHSPASESAAPAQSESTLPAGASASQQEPDVRQARPEPFEHAFGAQTHPAEPAAGDPAHAPAVTPAVPASTATPGERPESSDPSVAPEQ